MGRHLCHRQHILQYTGTWNVHSLVEITECAVLLTMVLLLRERWMSLLKNQNGIVPPLLLWWSASSIKADDMTVRSTIGRQGDLT